MADGGDKKTPVLRRGADTTMGGVVKTKFVPNIPNAARKKTPTKSAGPDLLKQAQQIAAAPVAGDGRGGGRGGRGAGRGGRGGGRGGDDAGGDGGGRGGRGAHTPARVAYAPAFQAQAASRAGARLSTSDLNMIKDYPADGVKKEVIDEDALVARAQDENVDIWDDGAAGYRPIVLPFFDPMAKVEADHAAEVARIEALRAAPVVSVAGVKVKTEPGSTPTATAGAETKSMDIDTAAAPALAASTAAATASSSSASTSSAASSTSTAAAATAVQRAASAARRKKKKSTGPVPFESPAIWFDQTKSNTDHTAAALADGGIAVDAAASGGTSFFAAKQQLFFFQLPSHLPTKPLHDGQFVKLAQAQKAQSAAIAAAAAKAAGVKPEPEEKKGAAAKKKAAAAAAAAAAGAGGVFKPVTVGGTAGGAAGEEAMTAAERDLAAQRARSSKLQSLFVPGASNSVKATPPGRIGTLIKYKSGALKLKIGDVLFDVARGSRTLFHQEILTVHPEKQSCYKLGDINKKLVVTLDVNSILRQMNEKTSAAEAARIEMENQNYERAYRNPDPLFSAYTAASATAVAAADADAGTGSVVADSDAFDAGAISGGDASGPDEAGLGAGVSGGATSGDDTTVLGDLPSAQAAAAAATSAGADDSTADDSAMADR